MPLYPPDSGGGGTPSGITPLPQGTGAAGASLEYSRGDHVHPFRSRYYLGPWKSGNIAAGATINMGYAAVSAVAEQFQILARDGNVTALCFDNGGSGITAGTITLQVRKITAAGVITAFTAAGEILTIVPTGPAVARFFVLLATPIAFVAGEAVGLRVVTSAALSPAGSLDPVATAMFEET